MKGKKEEKKIYIKNMVCNRCIAAVKQIFDKENIPYQSVSLGEVLLDAPISVKQKASIAEDLAVAGFELLDDAKSKLIAKIKTLIINHVHYNGTDAKHNLSALLSSALHKDYASLSRLFSEVEGVTIEKYSISQKIEKIKELLAYGEMNLSEIAFQMGYSSVAHLSAQFKKETGFTASWFRANRSIARKTLDSL